MDTPGPWPRGSALVLLTALIGCFDSDEVYPAREPATTTTGPDTTSTTESTGEPVTTTGPLDLAGDPDITCRDAIACVQNCIREIIVGGIPADPDLSCVVTCTEVLTVDEAYDLLRLANCVSLSCEAAGQCGSDASSTGSDTSSSTGDEDGSSSSGTGDSSSSSTDAGEAEAADGGDPPTLLDPCLSCLLLGLQVSDEACEEFHEACNR